MVTQATLWPNNRAKECYPQNLTKMMEF